ncbi:alginate lyase family protein [Maridesulfovibrio sp.]|uniref:alginate lyase family protein n=1 Tax=Maridesulfovibrio sp. TaxID=2795000 RepID=UPI002A18C4C3|nr:alginate lyase family protein [Maridesulfovibrio sp.]
MLFCSLSKFLLKQVVMVLNIKKLGWLIARLRRMSVPEVLYRVRMVCLTEAQSRGCFIAEPGDAAGKSCPVLDVDLALPDAGNYLQAADRILNGNFNIFALRDCSLGFPPNWNKDPLTGIAAPLVFGKKLNYRDEAIVGNIKYLWEPNRHLELVTLAQAYTLSVDEKYAHVCREMLDSWFEQCPYLYGPNWTSSLEHAVRLINWAFVWQFLGGEDSFLFAGSEGMAFRERWLRSVFQHCHFINGYYSRYSSANNHLLGEYMGLFVASTVWPCWKESSYWQESAKAGLEIEALKQNFTDGCNREQGIWYHHEVADMLLLCGLVGRTNGVDFSKDYWARLEAMIEFIGSMANAKMSVPMIGDSDDAVMVRFVPDDGFSVYQSLLATGAVLFNRSDFARKAGFFDDKSRWLLGKEGESVFTELLSVSQNDSIVFRQEYPAGGYYILGKDFETDKEVKLIVDAGPLGYTSIAAHGHADALAMVLSIGGDEILIDPGTYAYHTERKWRDYFKGTSAHNTVRIDFQDQSVSGGNFLWTTHAKAWFDLFEVSTEQDCFRGAHDGYTRLADPVVHYRSVRFEKESERIEVCDSFDCAQEHEIELFWHISESCSVEISEGSVFIHSPKVCLEMSMPESEMEPKMVQGNENLPLGWISRRFDFKVPSPTIVWTGKIEGKSKFLTLLKYTFK